MITVDPPRTSAAFPIPKAGLTQFLNRVRTCLDMSEHIDVLLADDATLRRLNRIYRGKNRPTDVLSFPAPDTSGSRAIIAGDLAISLDTAARQAAEHGHSLRDEVRILLLHGALHLAGYDHETDAGEMAAREAELRRELRLPTTLIARTQSEPAQPAKPSPASKAPAKTRPPAKTKSPAKRRAAS